MHKSLENATTIVIQTNTFLLGGERNYREWACRVTIVGKDGSLEYVQNDRPDSFTGPHQLAGELIGASIRDLRSEYGITVLTTATKAGKKSDLFRF